MVVAFSATAVVWVYNETTKERTRELTLITAEDIYLPASINKETFGLFFYDTNGNKTISKNATINKNKSLVIFFQSSDDNEDNYNILEWQQKGYNVGVFMWQQLADDDPYTAERKIWGRGNLRFSNNPQSLVKTKDTPKYSMAETFVAYYYDFMSKQNFSGGEIRFQGLSHGAQLIVGASSYLMELEKEGLIDKSFFPDRVTMFEAFFSGTSDNTYINWLDKPIGYDGTIKLACDTIKQMKTKGIAIEYIRSSLAEYTAIEEGKVFEKLLKEVCLLDYRSDWINDYSVEGLNEKHQIGQKWYNKMLEYAMPIDTASVAFEQYSISPRVPTSYIYARMGTKYGMENNESFELEDEIYFSTNSIVPLVAGFVFLDKNENGNNDNRIISRVDGVELELYMVEENKETLLGRTVSRNGGYYQFPIEPIFIFGTNGQEFYMKVNDTQRNITPHKGDSQKWYMMINNININKKSNSFFIRKKEEQIIINIGLTS